MSPTVQRHAILLAALSLLACSEAPPLRARGDEDVVVYLVDTLRRDRLGVYGYQRPTSPRLDALAREAFVFERAYAPSPWTLPSVVSLLTSTWPIDHGVTQRGRAVPDALPTLPRELRQLGFRTAAFSANPYSGRLAHLDDDFEHYEEFPKAVTAANVEAWLSGIGAQERVFLYVHTMEPHRPYAPPDPFSSAFAAISREQVQEILRLTTAYGRALLAEGRGAASGRQDLDDLVRRAEIVNALYDGGVTWADAQLGSLIEVLKRRGRWDRTLFVFVSDHGEELFDHGSLFHGHSLYAEQIRVPMLWRFPHQVGGRRVETPATLLDVMPTLLEYLGRPDLAARGMGVSLLPQLGGAARAADATRVASMLVPAGAPGSELGVALLDGRFKAIWSARGLELYDAEADPGERVDLAARNPEVAARIDAAARRWLAERPALPAPDTIPELDPQSRERLRELGYLP